METTIKDNSKSTGTDKLPVQKNEKSTREMLTECVRRTITRLDKLIAETNLTRTQVQEITALSEIIETLVRVRNGY